VRNALGSLNETKDHLGAGTERGYLTQQAHEELRRLSDRAIGASVNLAKYLEGCKKTWRKQTAKRHQE